MIDTIFDKEAISAMMQDPSGWRGSSPDRATFFEKDLFEQDGYKLSLHRFVGADQIDCFHSHPAVAIRCILAGGYCEQFPDGTQKCRSPGYAGLIYPETVHRVHSLLDGKESISLWIRMPKSHDIQLVGDGWTTERND